MIVLSQSFCFCFYSSQISGFLVYKIICEFFFCELTALFEFFLVERRNTKKAENSRHEFSAFGVGELLFLGLIIGNVPLFHLAVLPAVWPGLSGREEQNCSAQGPEPLFQ